MSLRDVVEHDLLPQLRRPSRYVAGELNSVQKDLRDVELRVALVFPDLYDLGLGNLGLQILYAVLNDLPWCWAERAYAPPPDLEAMLRDRGTPLFAHESRDPLSAMDWIGFTLQSELTYTNVLNIIDLSGLPLRSEERDDTHPLVCAGGPCALNPEPMAAFMDFFVVGDGEDAVVEVAGVLRALRGARRNEKLDALAEIDGVYVPARHTGGQRILRRTVTDLDAAPFPVAPVVSHTQQVHDRAGIEVMRGCTRGCRFCQAGTVSRPVRERSPARVAQLIEETFDRTGYEEASLVSLSTCDHSRIGPLVDAAAGLAAERRAAVSLPSLRADSFSVGLAHAVTGVRRTGLTFAPEAATPRLRGVINKWISEVELEAVTTEAYRLGWGHVKLYFMIGLPTERDEDVLEIAALCQRLRAAGVAALTGSGRAAPKVYTGISTFVPKPHTPFQWCAQIGYDETRRRQALLESAVARKAGLKFGRHAPEASFIEGLVARGDQRAGDLIEAAFRNGARLESSTEHLDLRVWLDAVDAVGFDVDGALGARDPEGPLPWDHIDALVSRDWLRAEWRRAHEEARTDDCRDGVCHNCGVNERLPELCAAMRGRGRETDTAPAPPKPVPSPVQRLRLRIGRDGAARFLSHLEWMTGWIRAFRRAQAPLSYSQGFHAHPKVTFATAAPVGEESEGDYVDIVLDRRVAPGAFLETLAATLPKGFSAFAAEEVPLGAPSLMSSVTGYAYSMYVPSDTGAVGDAAARLLASESAPVERKGKPKGRRRYRQSRMVDIRPTIVSLSLEETADGLRIDLEVRVVEGKVAKPREILGLLALDPAQARVVKRKTHLAGGTGGSHPKNMQEAKQKRD